MEEMRRTLEFFKWKSRWWLKLQSARANSTTPPDPQVQHGLRAYANRQASIYSSLVNTYVNHWRKFLLEHSLRAEWLSLYPVTPPSTTESTPAESADAPLEGDEDGSDDEDGEDSENPADLGFEEIFVDLHSD